MSEPTSTGALVERILGGDAPLHVRSAAARGALPLPRTELARVFVGLLEDADEAVRHDAKSSLEGLGGDAIREVLADASCAVEVLRYFADRATKDDTLAEQLVFHARVPDDVIALLAARGNARVIELVLTNQERLLSSPGLLDRLTLNPALRIDQRGRILELLDRVAKVSPATDGADADSADVTVDDGFDAAEAARLLELDVGELYAQSEILGGEELEQAEDPLIRDAYRKIITLNTAQKAVLAMKGGREERMILIRDTNKVVSLSVLRNPRINDGDVEHIAMMRNVSDEVLRTIGTNREWCKKYSVVKTLVLNPRTPPGISTNFVSRLVAKDLKNLSKDRNVPELVRRMAKRVIETRSQKSRVGRPGKH